MGPPYITPPRRSPARHCPARFGWVGVLIAALMAAAAVQAAAQEGTQISGRITDADDARAVEDAVVTLVGGGREAVTDGQGLFVFDDVPPGRYLIRVVHLAYGQHEESVEVQGEGLAIRIQVSQAAILLDPVVVSTRSRREADERARGTQVNVLDREEIVRYASTSRHVGDALSQAMPGIRVHEGGPVAGAATCIEFRTAGTPRFATSCKSPTVFLDGVRVHNPGAMLTTIPLSDLHRIEVIPPSEAGVLYGTDSMFGVILIETEVWVRETPEEVRVSEPPGHATYNWALESSGHAWKKVYLSAFIGNAAGLALGLAAARECIDFDELSDDLLNSTCGAWGTAGARTAALTLPVLGAALGSRVTGGTDLSHGRLLPAAVASAITLVPAYALISSSIKDDFRATKITGQLLLVFGVPAAATLADHLFRRVRGMDAGR